MHNSIIPIKEVKINYKTGNIAQLETIFFDFHYYKRFYK